MNPAGGARDDANRRPTTVSRAQRRSVVHEPCAVAPMIVCGLVRVRTAASVAPSSAQSASAIAIADAV